MKKPGSTRKAKMPMYGLPTNPCMAAAARPRIRMPETVVSAAPRMPMVVLGMLGVCFTRPPGAVVGAAAVSHGSKGKCRNGWGAE